MATGFAHELARSLSFCLGVAFTACAQPDANEGTGGASRLAGDLQREMIRLRAAADSVDAIFQPLPLLRPGDIAALRRFGNDAQLDAARRLGVAPELRAEQLQPLVAGRTLVRIADTTELWVVRRLDHSSPYLTPDADALLRELARRFQQSLADLGAPAFRLEITSLLRTAENQAQLRRTNPNAARGTSTHQFGTSFDIAYNAFAAPVQPLARLAADPPWLGSHLRQVAGAFAETIAARRSRELMAVLGNVLLEMQAEGRVMVTLEELQPVFHLTLARPAASR